MELLLAFAVGCAVGWLVARFGFAGSTADSAQAESAASLTRIDRFNRRLSKRQLRILEALPNDAPRPSIDDLVEEEAAELGIPAIRSDPRISLVVRLQVYRRDIGEERIADPSGFEYVLSAHAEEPVTPDDVRLVDARGSQR